jgi:hypothetical protein
MLHLLGSGLNLVLSNDVLRLCLIIVTSTMIGYTLQPVPQWLSSLFDHNIVFKFIVVFLLGVVSMYPLSASKMWIILISSLLVVAFYQTIHWLSRRENLNGQDRDQN